MWSSQGSSVGEMIYITPVGLMESQHPYKREAGDECRRRPCENKAKTGRVQLSWGMQATWEAGRGKEDRLSPEASRRDRPAKTLVDFSRETDFGLPASSSIRERYYFKLWLCGHLLQWRLETNTLPSSAYLGKWEGWAAPDNTGPKQCHRGCSLQNLSEAVLSGFLLFCFLIYLMPETVWPGIPLSHPPGTWHSLPWLRHPHYVNESCLALSAWCIVSNGFWSPHPGQGPQNSPRSKVCHIKETLPLDINSLDIGETVFRSLHSIERVTCSTR